MEHIAYGLLGAFGGALAHTVAGGRDLPALPMVLLAGGLLGVLSYSGLLAALADLIR